MANIRSAEKNIRKTKTRTARNQAVISRLRTLRKKVVAAVEKGDAKLAETSLSEFASAADKAAKTKVIHKNAASRLKSRAASKLARNRSSSGGFFFDFTLFLGWEA
jgi:small subunit ribosomal protein S20